VREPASPFGPERPAQTTSAVDGAPPAPVRRRAVRGAVGACLLLAAALLAAGCGTVGVSKPGEGDVTVGKELFLKGCGSCHVLADAGTKGTIGPNLDDAFAQSRRDGLGEATVQSVVRGQIAYPVETPPTGAAGMPKDIFKGDDAESVAAYVASVAAKDAVQGGGGSPTGGTSSPIATTEEEGGGSASTTTETGGGATEAAGADGEAIFKENCAACHTLAAAGATGTVGPNLDDVKPSEDKVAEMVANGGGAMPPFKGALSDAEIAAVAKFVSSSAGK
jgi:mono/diheme cytochrome c family protein